MLLYLFITVSLCLVCSPLSGAVPSERLEESSVDGNDFLRPVAHEDVFVGKYGGHMQAIKTGPIMSSRLFKLRVRHLAEDLEKASQNI